MRERLSGSALVSLHDDEVMLKRLVAGNERRLRFTRPSVQDEEDWTVPILAADSDPLVDAVKLNESRLFDS